MYGYLRGTNLKAHQSLHLAGVGDFPIQSLAFLPDPCPLPDNVKKRTLVEKEKSVYAPMSGVGGIVYDKGAFKYSDVRIQCELIIIQCMFVTNHEAILDRPSGCGLH